MNVPSPTPEMPRPVSREDLLSLKIEMMKLLGGAFVAFSVVLGLLGFFGFQQVMNSQLEKWANDEFRVEIEASKTLAKKAAEEANKSLDEVNVVLGNLKTSAVVPVGTIVPWFPPADPKAGADLRSIVPRGWALCDGSNGTPNLQERFILGTLDPKSVGVQGGSKKHNHSASFTGSRFEGDNVGRNGTGTIRYDDNRVNVNEAEAMPPFTMLIYIMKLP